MSKQRGPGWARLPRRMQYAITILLMAAITIAGYLVGRSEPIPAWIDRLLMPGLAWLGLVLLAIIALDWLRNR